MSENKDESQTKKEKEDFAKSRSPAWLWDDFDTQYWKDAADSERERRNKSCK